MATYAEIKRQIADLEKQAEKIRQAEIKDAVGKVKELIARYQLTAEDVGLVSGAKRRLARRKGKKAGASGEPKYRDPATGKTWTGRGKPPTWIAGAKSRGDFLINSSTEAAPARGASSTKKSAAAPKQAGRGKTSAAKKASSSKAVAAGTRRGKRRAKPAAQDAATPQE
jgi:DNA-binding protein H-NS